MTSLQLHEFHQALGARFAEVNGCEVVNDYGDVPAEHAALRGCAGALDLSFRGRICVTGGGHLVPSSDHLPRSSARRSWINCEATQAR